MTSIKFIAIDIDGTLLNENNLLAKETIDTITEARNKGIKVVLCTGRPITGAKPQLEKLGISGNDEYVITYNGALAQTTSGDTISKATVNYEDFLEVEMMARELDTNFQIETSDAIYTTNRDISPHTVTESYLVNAQLKYRAPEEITKDFDIFKLMFVADPEKIASVRKDIPNSLFSRMSIVQSDKIYLEFMNKKTSKGNAVKAVTEKLNINPDEVMAIGDQENDVSMLNFAKIGVAMGNAVDITKENADFVTKSNAENGVAYAIKKFAL
ncbi:sugar-phosphatase [Lactobacillus sp. S2-2]|uniref:sugar-phosphatase n=1 Tax=Lactobacillus sp. S2-2 TaxID=2692917 RepID=UPI001F38AB15|nr:sugar-phosphatase [Lactobacillus sp. S2-2]MCF6515859.1 sugar-phosphatase [Lactobacillus sp. S2-2]